MNICSFTPVKSIPAINERLKLIQRDLCYAVTIATTGPVTTADSGTSLSGTTVVLGQNVGAVGNPAALTSDREIPFNLHNILFTGTGKIGIGTATPSSATTLDVAGTIGASDRNYPTSGFNGNSPARAYFVHGGSNWGLSVIRATADAGGANMTFYRTRNVDASVRTGPSANDTIGRITFQTPTANGSIVANGLQIQVFCGTAGNGFVPMYLQIGTVNSVGAYAERLRVSTEGRVYIGGAVDATALLQLGAGTAAASTAPLKLTSGTNLTTAEAGAFEYNGTNLFFTRTGTTRETVWTGNSGATAPATGSGGLIVNWFGTDVTTICGNPNAWASVVIGGTTYKIPLYT